MYMVILTALISTMFEGVPLLCYNEHRCLGEEGVSKVESLILGSSQRPKKPPSTI